MSETEKRRRDDLLSDAEFLAEYEAKHGKEIRRPALRNLIPPQGGPTAKELNEAHLTGDLPPERVRIITHAPYAGTCKARDCGESFAKGEEVVMLYPSHRVVHARCARKAARERCGNEPDEASS